MIHGEGDAVVPHHSDPGIQNLLYGPFILRFKDDPRFADFCRKVGLPVPGETSRKSA